MSADDRKAEELIGQPAEKLAPRQTVADDLLGRPHTAEKSFAVDTRPAGETRFVTETPEERFAELQRMTSSYLDADDEAKLAKAFKFASEAHKGVCRKSGEPYIIHPTRRRASWSMPSATTPSRNGPPTSSRWIWVRRSGSGGRIKRKV